MLNGRCLRGIVGGRRAVGAILAAALLTLSSIAQAVVQFEITGAGGQSLPGQTVTIIPPDGSDPFQAEDDDNDGIIILPDADGPGWIARYAVNGQMMSVSGQVVTTTVASTTAGAAATSNTAWGLIGGIGLVTAGIISNTNNADPVPGSGTGTNTGGGGTTGGGTTGGGTTGGGTTGGGTTGGNAAPGTNFNADFTCMADTIVIVSSIVNPGGFTDAPNNGDVITVSTTGTTAMTLDINVPNLSVTANLACTTTGQFVPGESATSDCSGSGPGTFNGQSATINIANGFFVSRYEPIPDVTSLVFAGGDIDVQGLANPYSTRIELWCQ